MRRREPNRITGLVDGVFQRISRLRRFDDDLAVLQIDAHLRLRIDFLDLVRNGGDAMLASSYLPLRIQSFRFPLLKKAIINNIIL